MGTKKSIKPIFIPSKNAIPSGSQILDIYESALTELFFIENPTFLKDVQKFKYEIKEYIRNTSVKDIWIYFPWRDIVVRTVEEKIYTRLRTARNRNIITIEEQKNYRSINLGIIGLSIGSVILSTIVATGGPENIKLADYDEIEITNLNRMRGTILDVTRNKAIVAAQNSWEVDPFLNLQVINKVITRESIEDFIMGEPKLDIFIDSMDSLELKVIARQICKKSKIPCLMVTSNGDGVIFDVERFDLEPDRQLFHGRLGNITAEDFQYGTQEDWIKKALKIVDVSILNKRVIDSIEELKKTLGGVPQLSSTLQISGAIISYAIRKISNKDFLPSGRYILNLDSIFK